MDLVAVRLQAGETEEAFNVLSQALSSEEALSCENPYTEQAMQLVSLLSAALDKGPAPAEGKALLERFASGVKKQRV
jgi:hypothetical protein